MYEGVENGSFFFLSLFPQTVTQVLRSPLKDSDSGSRQCWWCGLSGAAVKATSDPWLTWRTPTITAVSSEKPLCGCAQSLESTSRRTACSISHRANGGANVSKTKKSNARGGPQRTAGQRAARRSLSCSETISSSQGGSTFCIVFATKCTNIIMQGN